MLCRRLSAALLLGVVFLASQAKAADNELTPEEKAAGWKLLFNGKDTTGWECSNGKPVATPVEDGSLVPFKAGGISWSTSSHSATSSCNAM